MDLQRLVYGDGSERFSPALRAGAAVVWLVMVYDLLDRIATASVESILVSFGFVLFVTLVVLLPVTFAMPRPRSRTLPRLAFDAVALSGLLIALAGLLIPLIGKLP